MISYRLRHHNLITRAKLPEFRFQVKKLIVTCIAMQPQENLYFANTLRSQAMAITS